MKRLLVLAFSLVTLILVGCGQVAQQTGSEVSDVTQVSETVVASARLTISMTGNESNGYSPSAIETTRIATQSVEIEANVPSFMTFDVNSTIAFDVNQLAWIEANGFIQINVSYNQLLEESLQNVRVRAYMVEADGLVGQINPNNIIPLEVEITAPPMLDPFSPLTTEIKNLKQWDKPFNQAINEIITLRLKGDFTGALNQQFKGTIMIEFVRDDEVDDPFTGFVEIQSITTDGASDWESFEINGETYLAVANEGGDSYTRNSHIYKWNGSSFDVIQTITTYMAEDWESFEIDGETFLVIANRRDGPGRLDSIIYKWNGNAFEEIQTIVTKRATDWESFKINDDSYIVVANSFEGGDSNIDSVIYKWTGSIFEEFQSIRTYSAKDWEYFEIAGVPHLIVANYYNQGTGSGDMDSHIYRWDGSKFVYFQPIPTNCAMDWESFEIDGVLYLAVANLLQEATLTYSKIYKWNGSSFEQIQSIRTYAAYDWESFEINGEMYIAVANHNDNYSEIVYSKIYKWTGSSFEVVQNIITNRASKWESFKIDGKTYLALANHQAGASVITESKIYKAQ